MFKNKLTGIPTVSKNFQMSMLISEFLEGGLDFEFHRSMYQTLGREVTIIKYSWISKIVRIGKINKNIYA